MRYAKIHFESPGVSANALVGLARRGQVIGLRDRTFIVPEPALEWLDSEKLSYQLMGLMNHDDVLQTLGDNLAHPVQ